MTVSLSLAFSAETVTASTTTRTLAGVLVRHGVPGRTSRGKLKVKPGALRFPEDLTRVKLTREHDRAVSRGHLIDVLQSDDGIRVVARASDGPEGDDALREATDRTRDGLSFDVVDATIHGDTITDALVIAVGQVGIPAYEDGRIDTVAAALTQGEPMTPEQIARLAELASANARTPEEEAEYGELAVLAVTAVTAPAAPEDPAPAAEEVAASAAPAPRAVVTASVPSGAPSPREAVRTASREGGAFADFTSKFANAMRPGNPTRHGDITAALADITHTAHSSVIEAPAWSGELWSGLVYEPQWSDLFNSAPLTNYEGKGWRFTSKLEIQDYAGDKAEIPTDNVTTEPTSYEAARMAVGVDIDRKFFDFPDNGFVASLFEQVRESWAIKLDAKIRAYTVAEAVAARTDERLPYHVTTNPLIAAQASLLEAIAVAVRSLKRRRVGKATWVYVNDDDYFTLFSITNMDVPAYLSLFGVDPENIRSSEDVPEGTVLAGVRQAATVRTLPGSPIRVEAQNLTRAGIDEAFFGYWAIEEHHTSGIAKATFTAA